MTDLKSKMSKEVEIQVLEFKKDNEKVLKK